MKNNIGWKILSLFLALVLIAGAIVGVVFWQKGNIEFHPIGQEQEQPAEGDETADNGGAVISEDEGNGIKMMSAKIATADYDEYGISPMAETAYQLTATITPANADNQIVDWFVDFDNGSSAWANGKTVSDYVTVTPTSDGALTANVECLQPFGEKINVKCVSRKYSNISASCMVDYAQKITGMTVTLEGSRTGDVDIPAGEDVGIEFIYYGGTSSYNVYTVSATAIYSDVYTLAEEATCKVSFLTSAGADDSHTYFNNHGSGGSMGSYSATFVDEVKDAIGKTFSFDNHMFELYKFRYESGSMATGEMVKMTTYYADLSGEELAERYFATDKDTVLWRVAASVEGKYGSYTREDSYLMYVWSGAGGFANMSLSEDNLIF